MRRAARITAKAINLKALIGSPWQWIESTVIERKVRLSIVRWWRAHFDYPNSRAKSGERISSSACVGQTGREGVGKRLLAGFRACYSIFVSTDSTRVEFEATLIFYIERGGRIYLFASLSIGIIVTKISRRVDAH
jgi:hypothetical protein